MAELVFEISNAGQPSFELKVDKGVLLNSWSTPMVDCLTVNRGTGIHEQNGNLVLRFDGVEIITLFGASLSSSVDASGEADLENCGPSWKWRRKS